MIPRHHKTQFITMLLVVIFENSFLKLDIFTIGSYTLLSNLIFKKLESKLHNMNIRNQQI